LFISHFCQKASWKSFSPSPCYYLHSGVDGWSQERSLQWMRGPTFSGRIKGSKQEK